MWTIDGGEKKEPTHRPFTYVLMGILVLLVMSMLVVSVAFMGGDNLITLLFDEVLT